MERLAYFLAGMAVGIATFVWWIGRTMSTAEAKPEPEVVTYTEYDGTQWTYTLDQDGQARTPPTRTSP